jgi:hypothetical protein
VFECPICFGTGAVPVTEHENEMCEMCKGKGTVDGNLLSESKATERIYDHFEDGSFVQCKYCNKYITRSDGANGLRKHLKEEHGVNESKATESGETCPNCNSKNTEDASWLETPQMKRCKDCSNVFRDRSNTWRESTEGGLGSGRNGHQGWMKEITEIKTSQHKLNEDIEDPNMLSNLANENKMCDDCMKAGIEKLATGSMKHESKHPPNGLNFRRLAREMETFDCSVGTHNAPSLLLTF